MEKEVGFEILMDSHAFSPSEYEQYFCNVVYLSVWLYVRKYVSLAVA
jgi:hypothetical protein